MASDTLASFMAYGDGVTELFVTNYLQKNKKRVGKFRHGDLCIPLGFLLANMPRRPSLFENYIRRCSIFCRRYEFGPIDDNVLIVIASSTNSCDRCSLRSSDVDLIS